MRILFVDDVGDTRFMFRTALELGGHKVRLAANGNDAISAVKEERFDVIVMDVSMPELDGWDATAAIRQLPHGSTVPIIIFTAHAQSQFKKRASKVGANYVLEKPMLPSELRAFLENLEISEPSL